MGAIAIGAASGVICFFCATKLKNVLGYDDSLDVFGIHAVGGIVGAMLAGVFCAESLGGAGFGGENTSIASQVARSSSAWPQPASTRSSSASSS